jgi:Asp-tRNA(Asn)/Glu-tRNA(Gln) amidotransferase A subunit family amidase
MDRWAGSVLSLALVLGACAPETGGITSTTLTTTSVTTTSVVATTTSTTTTLPPEPFDPFEATIPEIQAAMDEGRLSALELVDYYLDRIAEYDGELGAVLAVNPNAREEAAALDAERAAVGARGPLHGIAVVLKDNLNTFDMPTTAGSVALADFRPGDDSAQVAALREAGAIILAKTNMHELARDITNVSSLGGQTRNPYDPNRNPGGSSGGTAVAVTMNFAVAGLGTDTCGSVRIPSAFNGLYGLRPTWEWSSSRGVIPLTYTEDTVGPLTRSVIDLAIVLDVIAATNDRADQPQPTFGGAVDAVDPDGLVGRRIGVVDSLFAGAHPEVASSVRAALDDMAAAGATIVPVAIPGFDALRGNAATVLLREFRFAFDEYVAGYPQAPVSSLAELVALGVHHPAVDEQLRRAIAVTTLDTAEYRQALDRRDVVRSELTAFMDANDLDALAYPTIRQPAAPIGQSQGGTNCGTASVGGLPAIVVPAGTALGTPIGLELAGRPFAELTLIAIAAGYEASGSHRVPPALAP